MKKHIEISILSFCITILLPTIAYAGGFRDFLGYSLGLIVGLIALLIAWMIFPYTLSFIKILGKSPLDLIGARIGFAFLWGFLAAYVTFYFVAGHEPFQKTTAVAVNPPTVSQSTLKSEVKNSSTANMELVDVKKTNEEPKVVQADRPDTGEAAKAELSNTSQFPSNGQISASNVNIRSGHSIFADRIATLPKGQEVTVLERWISDSDKEAILRNDLQVQIAGQTKTMGKGKAVTIMEYDPSQKKFLVSLKDKSGTISGWTSEANVKSLKGLAWYKISTPAGKTGWVLGEFLSVER